MKRCFYTIGAESSGNRMLSHCLASAGVYGDPSLGHKVDGADYYSLPDLITLSRSVPHGDIIPEPIAEAGQLLAAGYEVVPIYTWRKTDFVVASQMQRGHATTEEEALGHIKLAAKIAYEFATWLQRPLITMNYGIFVNYPVVRDNLFAQLGLPPATYPLYNANEQYQLSGPVNPF